MQKSFLKKIFILIILFFVSNTFSQTSESRFSIEHSIKNLKTKSGKIISENGEINLEVDENGQIILENGEVFYDENLSKKRKKLSNLYDDDKHNKLNSDVKTIIENENINVDKIDWSNEVLFYVKIYAFIADDEYTNYITSKEILTSNCTYVITIEIGAGITPMANINGIQSNEIMNISIVYNNKTIGTVRWWDVSKIKVGRFLFVNSDWQTNVLHDLVIFSTEE